MGSFSLVVASFVEPLRLPIPAVPGNTRTYHGRHDSSHDRQYSRFVRMRNLNSFWLAAGCCVNAVLDARLGLAKDAAAAQSLAPCMPSLRWVQHCTKLLCPPCSDTPGPAVAATTVEDRIAPTVAHTPGTPGNYTA